MKRGDTPSRVRRLARRGRNLVREAADIVRESLSAGKDAPLPPVWLRDVGPSDFEATGREFLHHFTEIGQLRPTESVLDVGCGPGRMALPLTRYLDQDGRYVGMDVVAPAIRWCLRNISSRHPNFRFHHADLENARYNPSGRLTASEYRFPIGDSSFDFVFLTSVFTHMRPDDIQHYLLEIARLLRPSSRALCTFFLLNPTQQALAAEGKSHIDFRWDYGSFRALDAAVPEAAVALSEDLVRTMLTTAGLVLSEPVRYGTWSGREDGLSFQDIVVARPFEGSPTRRE